MNKMVKQVQHLSEITDRQPTFVAIGSFDGVHLGHQAILQQMVTAAQQVGARTAVITFFPHPRQLLQTATDAYYLATLADRVAWLGDAGVDWVIVHPFNEAVRQTRAADFVEQLCRYLDMRQLWGGEFGLGYNREGNADFLRALGQSKGYTVQTVSEKVTWQGDLVSSSRIRQALQQGDIAQANGCLSRPYRLRGSIIQGDQRGRTLGFPTANLAFWPEQLVPAHGVYATRATVGEKPYWAATNVGTRPTIDGRRLTVEAHLLDFSGNLYDQEIVLEFLHFIRPEQKFDGLDALKAQIAADVAQVRGYA